VWCLGNDGLLLKVKSLSCVVIRIGDSCLPVIRFVRTDIPYIDIDKLPTS
jgi:hypothetical protein